MLDREIKFAVPPDYEVPDLARLPVGLRADASERLRLLADYYDAADLRMARAGATLRHRSDEGWTFKLPAPDRHDLKVLLRRAYLVPGPRGVPPEALLDRARAWLRGAPVVPVARIRTARRRVRLVGVDGATVCELVDDHVEHLKGRRVLGRFREVKIELRDPQAPVELLTDIAARLRVAGASPSPPVPKLVRVLGSTLGPPEVRIEATDDTAGEAVRSAIARSVQRYLLHDPGLVGDEDPEDVHQARVALRRLRSDVRTFAALLESDWSARLREETSSLAALLGAVRDADVMGARLRSTAAEIPRQDHEALASLVALLEGERLVARQALLEARRHDQFLDLMDALVAAAEAPPLLAAATNPAARALPALVRRPLRRVRHARKVLLDTAADADLHRLRIEAKRLRYAAEAIAPSAGKRASALAQAAAGLQDVLGEHQDAVVLEGWFRERAVRLPPAVALVAGELVARERGRAAVMRECWPAAWRVLVRRASAWQRANH